jgi:2'-5' RNA ligase
MEDRETEERQLRLFVALELPERVRNALSEWAGQLRGTRAGLRHLSAPSLHATLCFLGARPREQVDAVRAACQVARGFPAVPLATGEELWLPRRHPRVLAVGLEDPSGQLGALQAELGAELARAGAFGPEPRSFLPHVTVARVSRDARRPAMQPPAPPALRFVAERIVLYRSHLGSGPARYEALHHVALSQG